MKGIDSKPLCLQDKGKGKKRQRWEFCGDPNRGLLRSVLMIPSIKFYSNSPMMPTNVKIIKIRLFYISRTFLHHHANVVSYWTNSSFKHGHFLITSCFERNLATLCLTDCSNKAKRNYLADISVTGGAKKMVQTANTHILKCQMRQKWSSQASTGYRTPKPEALPFLVSAHGRSYFLYEHMLPFRWQIAVM